MKTLAEILTALLALSADELGKATDEDRDQIAEALGFELGDAKTIEELESKLTVEQDKVKTLMSENTEMSADLKKYRDNEKKADRDKVIEAAIEEGKILPKSRARWERLYDADPEGTRELLAEKAQEIDYDKTGTSRATGGQFSDDIIELARAEGMEPAEVQELLDSVSGEGA